MKKGFTLIEMIGIIAVLALVLIVTFPNISQSLKQTKINENKNFTDNLKISTEAYIELNSDRYPELETKKEVTITIQQLYDANLLKGKYEGVNMTDTITIKKNEDSTLTYYYKDQQIGIEE